MQPLTAWIVLNGLALAVALYWWLPDDLAGFVALWELVVAVWEGMSFVVYRDRKLQEMWVEGRR